MNNYDRCGCCGRVVCVDLDCPGCQRRDRPAPADAPGGDGDE